MTIFIRLLEVSDKGDALLDAVRALEDGLFPATTFIANPSTFSQVPGSTLAYWVSERVRRLFVDLLPFERSEHFARSTNPLNEDFRYFRLSWETNSRDIGRQARWVPLSKGGDFSRFYSDVHLLIDWDDAARTYRGFLGTQSRPLSRPASLDYFFQSGLTYSRRSQIGFSCRVLPEGCIFHDKGPGIFCANHGPLSSAVLAILNSSAFGALIQLQMAFGSYEVGVIQRTPVPDLNGPEGERIGELALYCVKQKRELDTATEISHVAYVPALLQVQGATLVERLGVWSNRVDESEQRLSAHQCEIDDLAYQLYGITDRDRQAIETTLGRNQQAVVPESTTVVNDATDEAEDTSSPAVSGGVLATSLLSYVVGAILGRWDIRFATGEREASPLPNPFAPLPVCSPGMLTGDDGLPAQEAPPGYPLAVSWDGILVDDPGHPQDVIGRLREVLGVIWGERADAIYEEATQILAASGHDLRPWFRATFFDEHIKRYSKSRRKAPIYWRLATPSNSYAVWLYYHRFDRDTLYKALEGYVKPKVQYEERQAETLRAEAGGNPTASQRRSIEAQEAFVEELRTFRDEIERVAPLWNPDLNDGVIINFAPLWRLTSRPRGWQKECRDTWAKLARGDYDWAHLAMHLWPERVVPKCRADRSLAIAHGLDHQFWLEGADGKWQPRHVSDATLEMLIAERTSVAVQDALARLQDAPIEAAPAKRSRGSETTKAGSNIKKATRGKSGAQQAALQLDTQG